MFFVVLDTFVFCCFRHFGWMLCGHTLRCTHTTCFVVTHWDLHVCPHIMSPACHPLPYSFFHHSSPFLHDHFLGIENKIPEKQKSSQIFIVWHTMTGGVIGAPIIRESGLLCVCEDRGSSPTHIVFVNFQTLSTIINRPSSYQQLVDITDGLHCLLWIEKVRAKMVLSTVGW